MKKTMATLIAILTIPLATLFAKEDQKFNAQKESTKSMVYGKMGLGPLPLCLPSFGIGYRYTTNIAILDTNIDWTTAFKQNSWEYNAGCFFTFPKKSFPLKRYYFGPVIAGGYVQGKDALHNCFCGKDNGWFLSPKLVAGHQIANNYFTQLETTVLFPIQGSKIKVVKFPLVAVKMGKAF